jgi:hypothetical protein
MTIAIHPYLPSDRNPLSLAIQMLPLLNQGILYWLSFSKLFFCKLCILSPQAYIALVPETWILVDVGGFTCVLA